MARGVRTGKRASSVAEVCRVDAPLHTPGWWLFAAIVRRHGSPSRILGVDPLRLPAAGLVQTIRHRGDASGEGGRYRAWSKIANPDCNQFIPLNPNACRFHDQSHQCGSGAAPLRPSDSPIRGSLAQGSNPVRILMQIACRSAPRPVR